LFMEIDRRDASRRKSNGRRIFITLCRLRWLARIAAVNRGVARRASGVGPVVQFMSARLEFHGDCTPISTTLEAAM
jgi:hypothetical protein